MKKLLYVSFVCLVTMLLLSSCADKTDSDQSSGGILDEISKAMDGLSSYEVDGDIDITAFYDERALTFKGAEKHIYSGVKDEELYYYAQSDIDVTYKSKTTSTSVIEAFNEGEYFFSYTVGATSKKIRSEQTEEEFLNYKEATAEFSDILSGYEEFFSVENEDGSYEVKLGKYNPKIIGVLNTSYGFPMEKDGGEIRDIVVTILADSSYLVKEISIDYIFSKADFSGGEKRVYSNYGSAEKITDTIVPWRYETIGDAMIVPLLITLINSRVEEDEGSLAFSSFSEFSTMGVGAEKSIETEASYGYENGRYQFTADTTTKTVTRKSHFFHDQTTEEKKTTAIYKNGMRTDNNEIRHYSDSSAKAFIKQLIDPFSFSPTNVKYITKSDSEDGAVEYTISIETMGTGVRAAVQELLSYANANLKSVSMKIVLVVKDYKLMSINHIIESEGELVFNGQHYFGVDITLTTSTSFDD